MLKDLGPLLNNLPPTTAQALTQAINKCGRELGMGQEWVQRWVAFTIVADGLASYAPDGEPAFHFKGGAAIELRMRQLRKASDPEPGGFRPRATKDLDATYCGALQGLEAAIRAALAQPRHNFAFRIEVETPDAPHMRRFSIRVSYREERFGRVAAIGDGYNDVPMFDAADVGIAFNGVHPSPDALVSAADYVALNGRGLCRLLDTL